MEIRREIGQSAARTPSSTEAPMLGQDQSATIRILRDRRVARKAIARKLGADAKTVRRYLRRGERVPFRHRSLVQAALERGFGRGEDDRGCQPHAEGPGGRSEYQSVKEPQEDSSLGWRAPRRKGWQIDRKRGCLVSTPHDVSRRKCRRGGDQPIRKLGSGLLFLFLLLTFGGSFAQELVVEYELDQHPSSLNPLPATLRNSGAVGLTATALQRKRDDNNFFLVQYDWPGNGDFLATFWPSGCTGTYGLEWTIGSQPGYEWRPTSVSLSLYTSFGSSMVGPQHYVLRLFNDSNGQVTNLLDVTSFGGGFPLNEEVLYNVNVTDADLAAIGLGSDPDPVTLRFLFDGCEAGNGSQFGGLSNNPNLAGNGTNLLIEGIVVDEVVLDAAPSDPTPAIGSRVPTCLSIDMASSGEFLGSYGATLSWDPSVLAFVGVSGGSPPFETPIANLDNVGSGVIGLADADPNGVGGLVPIACVEFDVIGAVGTSSALDAELTSIFAAGTFTDLLFRAVARDGTMDVVLTCTVGDVNQDLVINSGDGLLILSDEVGLPIPMSAQESLGAGCGDANGDGLTDSIDANIILSWEVGIPVDPGFPIGGSNQITADCTVCGGSAAEGIERQAGPDRVDAGRPPELRWGWIVVSDTREELTLDVELDLGGTDTSLGSYSMEIAWNAGELEIEDWSPTPGFPAPLVNASMASTGSLRLAQVHPPGARGVVRLFRLRFRRLSRPARPRLDGTFTSLGSIAPGFESLLPSLAEKPTYSRRGH